MTAPGKEAFSK